MLILTDRQNYLDIADAIREMAETEDTYLPEEMADGVRSIERMNLFNFYGFQTVGVTKGSVAWGNGTLTLTATDNDCYTNHGSSNFPEAARIGVRSGQTVTMTWDYDGPDTGKQFLFQNGGTSVMTSATASERKVSLKATANGYFTFRFGVASKGGKCTYSNIRIVRTNP